jgi:hypothetical protein
MTNGSLKSAVRADEAEYAATQSQSPFKTRFRDLESCPSLTLAGPYALNGTGQLKADQYTSGCDLDKRPHANGIEADRVTEVGPE